MLKVIVIRWRESHPMDQWDRTESSEIGPVSSAEFDKGARGAQLGKEPSSVNGAGKTGSPHTKTEIGHIFSHT